ncbi:MAG TPA: DUF4832 domain-containing protein [Bacillota bacterium]|nr:DUF4832 domain-containing protein [Bacillota bacterium]HRU40360.1 DUF4832 domain-containing protein [Candidatus Diapherotrites archaeon]HQE65248.1 DUF4832 domain-containing protein [Bacillota bacterium]HQI15783.1 DUF4832 domain-containing protein [Bacillota bacterium]HQJ37415.1 DUF4832 domain-containing protein [Bacillota bacterium]
MTSKKTKFIIVSIMSFIISPLLMIHAARILVTGELYYPPESADVLNNPYKGWAPSAEGGPYEQPHSLVYINTTWCELEPEKGEYAFDDFEKKYRFNYWKDNNVRIILRLNMDFPGKEKHLDIPDWLLSEINEDGTWYDLDYGKGFSPNYSNPTLISYHKKLICALAARYNNNPQIPIIALGSLGHWGEWHTKQDQPFPIPFPPIDVSDQYVEHYLQYFTNKKIVMRRPFAIAKENKIGLYNDSFGDPIQTWDYFIRNINNGYRDYLTGTVQPAMPDFWKYAPSGGEIAVPPGMGCFEKKHINKTLKQIRDSHTSWLGPSCPAYYPLGSELQSNYELAIKTMGYRFVLYSVKHPRRVESGNILPVRMVWKNKGVAPFYFSWPVELSLSDSDSNIVFSSILSEDIRSWLPGKKTVDASLYIPPDLKEGNYTLCAAILDPDTGKPSIDLAIAGKRPDGRYSLNQVTIVQGTD